MEWSTPIDLYCERTDASLWAEPANALTNAAFLLAAAAAFLSWRRKSGSDWPALALIVVVVVVVVGLGSFTFHTVATRGAMLADVIPIALFIYGYLLLALCRFLHVSAGAAVAIVLAYAAGTQALVSLIPARLLNGSAGYLPALIALIVVALATPERKTRRGLALAALVFSISLAMRTIDSSVCATFPLGTHFAWHVLNAVVLYLLLRTAIAVPAATGSDREAVGCDRRGTG
jgi:Ceramidase